MDFYQKLSTPISKFDRDQLLKLALNDEDSFQSLMNCYFDKNLRICQGASWIVGTIADTQPQKLYPYIKRMIESLENPLHDAIIRNTVRAWQFMEIPEEYKGEVYEKCFSYLINPKYAVAIRAFSMTVCANICKSYPELKDELIIAIQENYEFGTSGFKNRATHTLQDLSQK